MSRGTYTRKLQRLLAVLLVSSIAFTLACTGADTADPNAPSPEVLSVQEKISGVWRLTNYIPEQDLSASLLMSMQSDKIMIRFEDGMVRSVSPSLQFERRYRITEVNGDTFHLVVEEEGGIFYEGVGQFDNLGSMSFQVLTQPWKGRGVLTREGPALRPLQ